MKLNLNETVKIKLTPYGESVREAFYRGFGLKAHPLTVDESGYVSMQLWSVIEIFGNSFHMGCDLPFGTDILVEDKNHETQN